MRMHHFTQVTAGRHGMPLQGISTTQKIQHGSQLKRSWQVFWDSEGVIHLAYLPHDVTVTCFAMMFAKLFKRKHLRNRLENYLHDASPRIENLMKVALTTMSWEIMNHPLQSPELAPDDFNLFWPMRVHLGGQTLQSDDELKCSVMN
jgi:hypothetical protein